MSNQERDDKFAGPAAGVLFLSIQIASIVGLVLIILLFWKGFDWYWETAYPLLSLICGALFLILLPLGLLVAIPKKSRHIGGLMVILASYFFFYGVWMYSLGVAYIAAGAFWMILGCLFAGVGVIGVALLGAVLQGEWIISGTILLFCLISYGVYMLGIFLMSLGPDDKATEVLDD